MQKYLLIDVVDIATGFNPLIQVNDFYNFKSNEKCAEFQISVKRFYRNANGEKVEETNVFDCEACGDLKNYLVKGFDKKSERSVRVVGRLKQNRWQDETGKYHSKTVVICEHIEFKPVIE